MQTKLTKFTIPVNANLLYPIKEHEHTELDTNGWHNLYGPKIDWYTAPGDKTILRCKQIKLKPNIWQRSVLIEWFALYRYTYNLTVSYIREHGIDSFFSLRPIIRKSFNPDMQARIDKCRVPAHTLNNAVNDAVKAYESSLALHKGKKKFRIRYKKEKANQTLVLEPSAFSKVKKSCISYIGVVDAECSFNKPDHACRLSYRNVEILLFVPEDKPTTECSRNISCCSLDPGLRTFQTIYCNNGDVYELGTNVQKKLDSLLDKLQIKTKARYKKRIRDKIKHLVDDLHWKSASILCKLSDKILIGNMSTVGVIGGNLKPRTKRALQALSHYTFRQRLKAKCEELGVEFAEVNESYTSKTCGSCSKLHPKLGADKIYKCTCGFILDRDINGARNIMIKHMQLG